MICNMSPLVTEGDNIISKSVTFQKENFQNLGSILIPKVKNGEFLVVKEACRN